MAILYATNFDGTIPFSDVCEQIALATNTDSSYTIPGTSTDKYVMTLSYISTSNIFVCKNAAATVPGAGLKTATPYLEFKPSKRYVQGGDVIHFITPDASAYVGLSLMSLLG